MSTRLQPGDTAPDFTLTAADGSTVSLADLRREHEVIVYFYPAASTPGCTTEACDFRDNLASLQSQGYAVVGLSPDPVAKLVKFVDEESLSFPLLSDEDHAVAEAYGAWGEKKNYGRTYMGVIRSAFLVDEEGNLAEVWPKITPKDTPKKLLAALGS